MIQSKFIHYFSLCALLLTIVSCNEDDAVIGSSNQALFVVAFETQSTNLSQITNSSNIPLVYSTNANQAGSFTINFSASNATYGEDFTTIPEAVGTEIFFDINTGDAGTNLVFNKLNATLDETTEITFTITAIDYESSSIQGNTSFVLNNSASLGRSLKPEVGGPNEGNQVFIDLSTEQVNTAVRDSWDLAFYSNDSYQVGINGAIYMAAGQLESSNIDTVTQADIDAIQDLVAVGTFDPANVAYIDNPNGNILETAISTISANDDENKVYLVNLGFEVGTEIPEVGSVAVAGDPRGWKKIRILRSGPGYILQYANLNDANHQTVSIPQSTNFNATYFSFNTNTIVNVQPQTEKWDIAFTVFTNVLDGAGSYGFSDGVLHNRTAGVTSYEVLTGSYNYETFTLVDIDNDLFQQDQRAIGSNWRDVFDGIALDDRFYILKDTNNNFYKLKFLALTSDEGVRGYPEFEYQILN